MSVIIFFGMAFLIILVGIAVIVTTLLQWKREGMPPKNGLPLANKDPERSSDPRAF